jgi:hypothetical protein
MPWQGIEIKGCQASWECRHITVSNVSDLEYRQSAISLLVNRLPRKIKGFSKEPRYISILRPFPNTGGLHRYNVSVTLYPSNISNKKRVCDAKKVLSLVLKHWGVSLTLQKHALRNSTEHKDAPSYPRVQVSYPRKEAYSGHFWVQSFTQHTCFLLPMLQCNHDSILLGLLMHLLLTAGQSWSSECYYGQKEPQESLGTAEGDLLPLPERGHC